MSDEIKVTVVKFGDRKLLQMQFVDPMTKKKRTRSTGTAVRRDAERAAAKWEQELREGRFAHAGKTSWADFRKKYEDEVLPGLAESTGPKISGVFNAVEAILNPEKVRELTSARLSYFQAALRNGKRAESTIATMLAHLRSALRWATKMGILSAVPVIERPKRAKGATVMKGRPISGEELDRMIDKVEAGLLAIASKKTAENSRKRIGPKRVFSSKGIEGMRRRHVEGIKAAVPAWQRYIRGLWLSGLRLEESTELYWDRPDRLCVDFTGKRPMLWIPAALEKGNQDRLLPMAPEFAVMLLETPEAERHGRVFKLPSRTGDGQLAAHRVGQVLSAIGKAAGIKVHTNPKNGKVKYASAHDMRRSFGERWASRVMPQTLMELMRHESIETTLRFYIGRNAEKTADLLWAAHDAATGNTPGNTSQNGNVNGTAEKTASDYAV